MGALNKIECCDSWVLANVLVISALKFRQACRSSSVGSLSSARGSAWRLSNFEEKCLGHVMCVIGVLVIAALVSPVECIGAVKVLAASSL